MSDECIVLKIAISVTLVIDVCVSGFSCAGHTLYEHGYMAHGQVKDVTLCFVVWAQCCASHFYLSLLAIHPKVCP